MTASAAVSPLSQTLLAAFVLFCRIGACVMIAPGLGNSQIPTRIRLYVAIAISLGLLPLLAPTSALAERAEGLAFIKLIATELIVGALLGFLARLFFAALETLSFAASTMLGLSNPFGVAVDQNQALPPLASFVTLGASVLVFVTDAKYALLIGVLHSYDAIPVGAAPDLGQAMAQIGRVLRETFLMAAQIASPFLLYSVIVNFAIALVNRVTPQVAVFFIAPPFVVGGGLLLTYFTLRGQLFAFISTFSNWLDAL